MEHVDWRVNRRHRPERPFCTFAGVDRVILLLRGDGIHLQGDGVDHRLNITLAPFAFSGDVALGWELLGGTSTDFNVTTGRGRIRADVRRVSDAEDSAAAPAGVLPAVGGAWQLKGAVGASLWCAAGPGPWWNDTAQHWRAVPMDKDSALVMMRAEAE